MTQIVVGGVLYHCYMVEFTFNGVVCYTSLWARDEHEASDALRAMILTGRIAGKLSDMSQVEVGVNATTVPEDTVS